MGNTKTYLGFTNRTTWYINLLVTNDRDLHNKARECGSPEELEELIAKHLRSQVTPGLTTYNFVSFALADVDWDNIFSNLENSSDDEMIDEGLCPKCGGNIFNRSIGDETYAYCDDCQFSTAPL